MDIAARLVAQADEIRALPHVAEVIEGAARIGEGHLALADPVPPVARTVQEDRSGEVRALDAEHHPVGPGGAIGILPNLRVAEVGGVALGLAGDDRFARLHEGPQVRGFDEALGRFALPRPGVLVIPRVPEFNAALDADRRARVGAIGVLMGVGEDRGGPVVPVDEVLRDRMPPVDEFERMLGRVLKEGVVVLAVDDEAVGVVEAPDGGATWKAGRSASSRALEFCSAASAQARKSVLMRRA